MQELPASRRRPAWPPTAAFAIVAAASALALLAPLGWPFELFAHFRSQYAVAALLLVVPLAWQRRPAWVAAALLLAAWHGLPVAQRAVAMPAGACHGGPAFTVATANLHFVNEQPAPFLDWLAERQPDLVVVQELTAGWAEALRSLPQYPHRYLLAREDAYGIGVLSRRPLHSVHAADLADDGLPSLTGVAEVGGQRVRFLGLHARWPIVPRLANARDRALGRAAALARAESLPVVLLGDLNLSPDAPAFGRLLGDGGLRDVVSGPDWRPTWQAGFWPLALRIDHVLVSGEICVERAEVGAAIGSDHRPVIARLRLPTAPVRPAAELAGPVGNGA